MGKKDYFRLYGGKPGLDYILTDFRRYALEKIGDAGFDRMVTDNPHHVLAG